MSSVSQIITFRKGRAFTTHRSEPPQVPAPPPAPSATVTLGTDAHKKQLAAATYTQQVQKAVKIEFGSQPTDVRQQEAEKAAEQAARTARVEKAEDAARSERADQAERAKAEAPPPPAPPPRPPVRDDAERAPDR